MSDKIRERLQENFEVIHKLLLKRKFRDIISDQLQKVEEEEDGTYHYRIPLNNKKGFLQFDYLEGDEDDSYRFVFVWKQAVEPHSGIYCYDIKNKISNFIDGNFYSAFFDYMEDEGDAGILVYQILERSWKRPSESKNEEMYECIDESWQVMEKATQLFEKERQKPNFYDVVETAFNSALKEMSSQDSSIKASEAEIMTSGEDIDDLHISMYVPCKDKDSDFTMSFYPAQGFSLEAWGSRYGVTQKKCQEIWDKQSQSGIDFTMEGRGKDAIFCLTRDVEFKRKDFDKYASSLARDMLALYDASKQLSSLFEKAAGGKAAQTAKAAAMPAETIESASSSHSSSSSRANASGYNVKNFKNLATNIYESLLNGAIKGLKVENQQLRINARIGDKIFSAYIYCKGDIFRLGLRGLASHGSLDAMFQGFLENLTAERAKQVWDDNLFKTHDTHIYSIVFSEDNPASFIITYNFDLSAGTLDQKNIVEAIGKFYDVVAAYAKALKKDASKGASDSHAVSGKMAAQSPAITESSPTPRRAYISEASHESKPIETPETAFPSEAAQVPQEPEGDASAAEARLPDASWQEQFGEASQKLLSILKGISGVADLLPDALADPQVTEDEICIEMALNDSPLILRILCNVEEEIMEMGWVIKFAPAYFGSYRNAGKKFKKPGLHARTDKSKNTFALFYELPFAPDSVEDDKLRDFGRNVAKIYGEALSLKMEKDRFARFS